MNPAASRNVSTVSFHTVSPTTLSGHTAN